MYGLQFFCSTLLGGYLAWSAEVSARGGKEEDSQVWFR